MPSTKQTGRTILLVSAIAIAALTLTPSSNLNITSSFCVFCGEFGFSDFVSNIILFLPVGIACRMLGGSTLMAVGWGLGASLFIETLQLFVPGRDPGISDLLSNSSGAVVGSLLAKEAVWWAFPTPRRALVLKTVSLVGASTAVFASGYLLGPSITDSNRYYAEFAQTLDHGQWVGASADRVTLGNFEFDGWGIEQTGLVKALLERGASIAVAGTAGPRTSRPKTLFTVYDHDDEVGIISIAVDREDLVYRYRSRTADVLVDSPDLRFIGGLRRITRGDEFRIMIAQSLNGDGLCFSVNGRQRCGIGYTVGSGWGLLNYPTAFPNVARSALNLLWLGLLFLPFGFLARKGRDFVLGGVVIIALLSTVPIMTTLVATPPLEWLAAVAGMPTGWGLARYFGKYSMADALALFRDVV